MVTKKFKIIFTVAAVVAIAGISTTVAMKLRAGDRSDYKARIAARKSVEYKGEKLEYVELTGFEAELYEDYTVYKDSAGQTYYFLNETQELRVIHGNASEGIMAVSDSDTMLEDAKAVFDKYFEVSDKETYTWEFEDGGMGDTYVNMYQVLNVKGEEFPILVGSVSYDENALFNSAVFYSNVVNSEEVTYVVTEEEAIEKAKDYLEENYGKTEWKEITARIASGSEGHFWSVTCIDPTYICSGDGVFVDIFTGEVSYEGPIK